MFKLSLTATINDAIDYHEGESMECLVTFGHDGIVSCDVSELAQFATLPGIARISIDGFNGFRELWNASNPGNVDDSDLYDAVMECATECNMLNEAYPQWMLEASTHLGL